MLSKEEIAIRFKHIRDRTGLAQKAFGLEVGLTEYSVIQIEKGRIIPDVHVISSIELLGYNRDYFFVDDANPLR